MPDTKNQKKKQNKTKKQTKNPLGNIANVSPEPLQRRKPFGL